MNVTNTTQNTSLNMKHVNNELKGKSMINDTVNDKFVASLKFLNVNTDNLNKTEHEKFIYKFEDETVNKHWLSFLATYKSGRKSAFDDIGVWAIQNVNKVTQ